MTVPTCGSKVEGTTSKHTCLFPFPFPAQAPKVYTVPTDAHALIVADGFCLLARWLAAAGRIAPMAPPLRARLFGQQCTGVEKTLIVGFGGSVGDLFFWARESGTTLWYWRAGIWRWGCEVPYECPLGMSGYPRYSGTYRNVGM